VSEHNKQVVRRYFEELDRTKASPVDLVAAGFRLQAAGFPAMDLEDTQRFTHMFFGAFPDLTHPVDELIAQGDTVAFR
jgi:predicted ester cyclase